MQEKGHFIHPGIQNVLAEKNSCCFIDKQKIVVSVFIVYIGMCGDFCFSFCFARVNIPTA